MCIPPFAVYRSPSEAQEKSIPPPPDDGTAVPRLLVPLYITMALLPVRKDGGMNFPDGLYFTSVT